MIQVIYIGAAPNDKTGTPARQAGQMINENFAYLDARISNKDQIVTAGTFALVDNVLTIYAGWVWKINGNEYTNPADVVITFDYAATDNQRLDRIVCNTSNTFTKIPGTESETNPVAGPVPADTIEFMVVLVTDSEIGDPTPPITGENFVDRTTAQEIYGPKTFRETTRFRSDATDDYTSIFEDKFTFWKNQEEEEDKGSVSITAVNDVIGDFTQELQGKDGIVALIEDVEDLQTEIETSLADKVDKITGKGLSTEDYTTAEKNKLSYITITQAVNLDDIETRVNELDAAVVLKGTWSAATGTFPGSGIAQAGWSYLVSADGTVDGIEFKNGDRVIAVADNASTSVYASNWYKADYTDRVNTVAGRTGNVIITSSDLSDFNSAVNALIATAISGKEDTSNKTGTVAGNEASTTLYLHIAGMIAYFQQKLTDSIFGTFMNSLTDKATPVDGDSISVVDSADSNKQKKVSLTNFKAFLKTYFDTLYAQRQALYFYPSAVTTTFTADQKNMHISRANSGSLYSSFGLTVGNGITETSGVIEMGNLSDVGVPFIAPFDCLVEEVIIRYTRNVAESGANTNLMFRMMSDTRYNVNLQMICDYNIIGTTHASSEEVSVSATVLSHSTITKGGGIKFCVRTNNATAQSFINFRIMIIVKKI